MSVLLFPPPPLRQPALVVTWAAVAVGELVLAATGLQATIKWPNDVHVHGKKVCGILIEQRNKRPCGCAAGRRGRSWAERDAAGRGVRGGRAAEGGLIVQRVEQDVRHGRNRGRLIGHLDEEYDRLVQGDFAALEARWKSRLGLLGQRVASKRSIVSCAGACSM